MGLGKRSLLMKNNQMETKSEITKETLIGMEEKIRTLFLSGNLRCAFHLSGGNEEQLLEIFKGIKENDWVFSTHRGHYHAMLKGMSEDEVIGEVLKGKSMHIYSKKHKIFTSSIVGGILPIALGIALANKRNGSLDMVWVFVGDMCSRMGVFHECSQYSEGHDLPIIFVVEDNGLSINTNTKESWGTMNKTNKIKHYEYKRIYPHVGSGDWVDFGNIQR